MKYFIIVGERSGDLHASWLVKAILTKDPTAEVIAYGGDMMQAAGAQILSHYKEGAFMGFLEVVRNLPAIIRRMSQCKADISAVSPDLLILVDYPGFNLKMAAYAKGIGLKTAYYISPKIWAWKKGRIKAIRKFVDHMFVIFPFEVSFYDSLSYQVNYVGNPLVEQIGAYKPVPLDVSSGAFTKLVAFLPGSRSQEVKASEPYILELASAKPEYLFLVTQVDNLPDSTYNEMRGVSNIRLIIDRTYDCLSAADVANVRYCNLGNSITRCAASGLLQNQQIIVRDRKKISGYQVHLFG
jgi:lipid-A-disaccharide synthase